MQCDTEKKGNHDECMIKTELFLHFRSQSVMFIAGSQQKIYNVRMTVMKCGYWYYLSTCLYNYCQEYDIVYLVKLYICSHQDCHPIQVLSC